jgi:hypothetical protein
MLWQGPSETVAIVEVHSSQSSHVQLAQLSIAALGLAVKQTLPLSRNIRDEVEGIESCCGRRLGGVPERDEDEL